MYLQKSAHKLNSLNSKLGWLARGPVKLGLITVFEASVALSCGPGREDLQFYN